MLPSARPGCLITVGGGGAVTPDMPSGCAKHMERTGGFSVVEMNREGEGDDGSGGVKIWPTRAGAWQPLLYKSIYAWQRRTGCRYGGSVSVCVCMIMKKICRADRINCLVYTAHTDTHSCADSCVYC